MGGGCAIAPQIYHEGDDGEDDGGVKAYRVEREKVVWFGVLYSGTASYCRHRSCRCDDDEGRFFFLLSFNEKCTEKRSQNTRAECILFVLLFDGGNNRFCEFLIQRFNCFLLTIWFS